MAEPYQPQTNPGGSAAFSGASPEAFGAAIGRGVEEAGGAVKEAGAYLKAQDLDTQNAAAGVQFAKISSALDQAEIEGRNNAAPGGAGHTATIVKTADDQITAALGQIKDPKLRQAYQVRYAELHGNVTDRAYAWEAAAGSDKIATDFDTMGTTLANGAATARDPVGLQVSLDTIATAGKHLNVAADLQTKLTKEQQRKVVGAYANATVDSDPRLLVGDAASKTKGLLDDPRFTQYLEPEDIKALRNGAHVEIRRDAAEQRAAFDHAKAQASEDNSTFLAKIHDGYVPTAQELDQHDALAKQYSLDKQGWDLGVVRDQANINQQYRTATPALLHATINELSAKQAAGKTSQAENVHLKNLVAFAGPAIDRFNADPYAAAAAAGKPAPQVDWSNADPKAVEARATWARAFAKSAGLVDPPYLSNDDLKQFRALANQGPGGQLTVASAMRQAFGAEAGGAVRQIDPGNTDLQLMVGLPDRMGQLYREGANALKAGTVKLGADADDNQAMRDTFAKFMPAIPAGLQDAVNRAAMNITAGTAAEFSNSNPSREVLTRTFEQAIQRAGGRTGQVTDFNAPGGFAEWNGRYAWLPSTVTSNQFIQRISRAGAEDWAHAAGGEPYYRGADGKLVKMSEGQIGQLKNYPLVLATDNQGRQTPGIYQLLAPDGHFVAGADGYPWKFDIRKLTPLAAYGYVRR